MTAWPMVKLGEVIRPSAEQIAIKQDATYREVTIKMHGKGVVLRRECLGAEISAERKAVVRRDQLILSRIDARNGALGLVPESLDGAVVSNDFPSYEINRNKALPAFLGWLVKTGDFIDRCAKASEGTTNRVRLKESAFLGLEIPLPPLPEQQKIVIAINELASCINQVALLRERVHDEMLSVMPSQTSKIVDGLTGHRRMPIHSLGVNGANPIQIGPFGAQLHKSDFISTGVPVLNVGNVWPSGLRLDYLDYVSEAKADQLSRYRIGKGDLLFARSGATLGKVCLVPDECDGWLMTGHLFRVRFDPKRVFNRYAFALLRDSVQVQDQVFGQVRGATRPGYNTTLLGSVELPIPSIPEQESIVAELDVMQYKVASLMNLQNEASVELDIMLPSILSRAFSGHL